MIHYNKIDNFGLTTNVKRRFSKAFVLENSPPLNEFQTKLNIQIDDSNLTYITSYAGRRCGLTTFLLMEALWAIVNSDDNIDVTIVDPFDHFRYTFIDFLETTNHLQSKFIYGDLIDYHEASIFIRGKNVSNLFFKTKIDALSIRSIINNELIIIDNAQAASEMICNSMSSLMTWDNRVVIAGNQDNYTFLPMVGRVKHITI